MGTGTTTTAATTTPARAIAGSARGRRTKGLVRSRRTGVGGAGAVGLGAASRLGIADRVIVVVRPPSRPLRSLELAPVRRKRRAVVASMDLEPAERLVQVGATQHDVLDPRRAVDLP